ncbi:MAG: cytochrome C family, partial [Geobacteraceae bacterium]
SATANSHEKHVGGAADCIKCHTKTTATGTSILAGSPEHVDGTIDARFSKVSSFTNFSGAYNKTGKTCSATYCHAGSTPQWGANGTLNCASCHKADSTLPGKHNKHYESATVAGSYTATPGNNGTAGQYQFQCSSCHGLSISNHASGPVSASAAGEIFFGYSAAGKRGTYTYGATVTLDGSLNWTNGTCANTYCHSNGAGAAGNNTTFTWAAPTLGCADCHGDATTAGKLLNTGKHQAHVNNAAYLGTNFGCADCHAKTVTSSTAIADKTRHVNKFMDYSGVRAGRNKTCSNIYCHSNGKGNYINPTGWSAASTPLACNGCHLNTSSSHPKHVTTSGITCDKCHNATAASNTALVAVNVTHVNGNAQDVSIAAAYDGNGVTGNYTPGTQTCSSVTCHSNGKGGYQDVAWGATLNCGSCHPFGSLSAGHAKHIDVTQTSIFYTYTANRSGGDEGAGTAKYRFGCSTCHPTNEAIYHTNGTIDLTLKPESGIAGSLRNKNVNITTVGKDVAGSGVKTSGATVTCDNVYCHTNAYATSTNWSNVTPAWTGSFANADRCANCHGNSPSVGIAGSAAHAAHVVGIHSDDIFTGTSGKLTAGTGGTGGNTTAVGHGSSVQATTINCNICHNATVTYARNDRNPSCSITGCHAAPTNLAQINNRANHVNGKVDVSFQNVQIVSKAQLRKTSFDSYTAAGGYWTRNGGATPHYKDGGLAYDTAKAALNTSTMWNAGACSNIACHMGKTVNWNDTTVSCQSCHSKL